MVGGEHVLSQQAVREIHDAGSGIHQQGGRLMRQLQLPFTKKPLKVGDRVRIVGKSIGTPLPCFDWKIGDTGTVSKVIESPFVGVDYYYLDKKMGGFLRDDLVLVDRGRG